MKPSRREDIVGIPVPVDALARALDRHADYRIVRRMVPMERMEPRFPRTGELSVCVVGLNTTGRDHLSDRIVELSIQTVRIDAHARIVQTAGNNSWLEDPEVEIPLELTRRTGIASPDVRGRRIADGEAYGELVSADILLSHDARRDRPFLERRLDLDPKPWICSRRDLDWVEQGFSGHSLALLLLQCGWFFEGRRAAAEVGALLHLLDHRMESGVTALKEMLVGAGRATWTIEAVEAPVSAVELLKARGYRWNPARRAWTLPASELQVSRERSWARNHVYSGTRDPLVRKVTWKERYRAT